MPLQEPSERERRSYYYGLPSCPKLVARSSTAPWNQPYEWPDRKRLYVATGHAIQQPWNDPNSPLQRLIIATLDGIDWTAIDILRIGYKSFGDDYRRIPELPVTMLISVSTNSTTFQEAEAVIIACKEILARFNLDDVEVEIKESVITTAASNSSLASPDPTTGREHPRLDPGPFDKDFIDIKYRHLHNISEYMGTSIDSPSEFKQGTKYLYLQGNNGKTYALTCRHTLFSESYLKEYRHGDGNDTKYVRQPGSNSLSRLVERFKVAKGGIDETIVEMAKPAYADPKCQAKLPDFLQEQLLLQSCQPRMEQFYGEVSAVVGHVEFSPPIGLCSQGLRVRGWALVELAQESFTTNLSKLRNKIPVTKKLQDLVGNVPVLPARRPLWLRFSSNEVAIGPDLIPECELKGTAPSPSGETLFVIKHGLKTKFTIGIANGIHSVARYTSDIGDVISSEWCIIGTNGDAFSDAGDSGACVFDPDGRIGGMITAGLKSQDYIYGYDVTYAAPMQWLLDEVKKEGYDLKLPN
ncbi:uncharacterized protein FSUBG_10445 [Fusarium subglutinans]|uniref:Peptidase S1 domain-containing protein n=1 Tax=Gibberella subglutinans TaxID=42677 RepID=A0A8H5P7L5_GIBSU|nr:uncharacterized protein FSUBG_10445 [Fusarium subglutinans]KAF5591519.1 hypothetical protein FSUBG_10445 [Fusarium subglutinans]